jgi:integrase/recombinase XerD
MVVKQTQLIGTWIRRFLVEHLVGERNLSLNTQQSYRDTFVLLMPRLSKDARKPVDHLEVGDLSADRVRAFLNAIELDRRCSA